jgi:hypothetical protein
MAQEPMDIQPLEDLAINCDIEDDADSSTLQTAAKSSPEPEGSTATWADEKYKGDLEEPEAFVPHSCAHCQKIVVNWPIDGESSRVQRLPYSNKQAYRAWKDGCRLYGYLLELSKKPSDPYLNSSEKGPISVAMSAQEFVETLVAQIGDDMRRGVLELVSRLQRPFSLVCYTRTMSDSQPSFRLWGRLGRSQSHLIFAYVETGNVSETRYETLLNDYSKSRCSSFPRQTL